MNTPIKNGDKPPYWLKVLHQRIPITGWLRNYSSNDAVSDLIAGITVGLTVMPQSLAYATLAGLDPQYGLYSAFAGSMVYVFFGSCKDITIGPTALMSLMTHQQVINRNADYAILLCFLSGIIHLLMAVLHLGVLIDFISIPVTVGFTSATSVIITVSQIKGLLGLQYNSSGFIDTLQKVYQHIHETSINDAVLGITCIMVLIFLRKIKDINLGKYHGLSPKKKEFIGKLLWLISTSRNAIVVITCSFIVYAYTSSDGKSIVMLTGTVKSGLPDIGLPPFSTIINGKTDNFFKICSELGASIILVPIIAVLGNVAIAKAFSSGDSVDATQELFTLGLCNVIGSFVSSMPVTGSFSRSAVNHASGVRTPMGGLYTGVSIILALSLLTPYCYYIPKASLAAVIICAVAFMIEYEVVKPMWTSTRKDLIPALGTFTLCLVLGVEIGIVIGVALNIILLLIPSARPSLHYEKLKTSCGIEYIMITPGNSLYFPAIDFLRSRICKIGSKYGNSKIAVVVDCRYILGADFTAAKGISALIQDFKKRKQLLLFFNPRNNVLNVLKCVCSDEFLQIYNTAGLEQVLRRNGQTGGGEGNETMEDIGIVLREVRSDVSVTNNAESNIPLLKLQ